MFIKDLLKHIDILKTHGQLDREISSIQSDSRLIEKGDCFVAVKGTVADGHQFISKAVGLGAEVIVCEEFPVNLVPEITYVQVENARKSLAWLAAAFYGFPSHEIKMVGITGTNGKTTVATSLYHCVKELGYKAGLISTVKNMVDENVYSSKLTTPDPLSINRLIAEMVEAGCEFCFMEVSSHAVDQDRISGIEFTGAVFTNITQDHLDYHKSFLKYIQAKKGFFDQLPKTSFALVNKDDKNAEVMLQNSSAIKKSFALKSQSDFHAIILEQNFAYSMLDIDGHELYTSLVGTFNAYNILAVYATLLMLQFEPVDALRAVSKLKPVEGRFQNISLDHEISAIVDYAHTPDALSNILEAIQKMKKPGQQLITIIGAGGDRDKGKRPLMGEIAARLSDKLIISSDNPRTEDPNRIIEDIVEGVPDEYQGKMICISDRKEAIKAAVMLARSGDIILVAGKGHETYQEIQGVRHHFDDREILIEFGKK